MWFIPAGKLPELHLSSHTHRLSGCQAVRLSLLSMHGSFMPKKKNGPCSGSHHGD